METNLDCVPCFLRQALEAVRHMTQDVDVHERIVRDVLQMAAALDFARPPPYVGQAIHRRLRDLTGLQDPYRSAKSLSNRVVTDVLPELSDSVKRARDPLLAAAKYSIAANALDMAVVPAISERQVCATLHGAPRRPLNGQWEEFLSSVVRARDVLYLADNAGEIAVDRLLIEQIGPERVTLVVRGSPVLNDATLADVREVGLDGFVEVIDNGSDAPGTILSDCSSSFQRRFREADLIISKGQGNFESLSQVKAHMFFLFKVKCSLVARQVGLPLGAHALLRQADAPGG